MRQQHVQRQLAAAPGAATCLGQHPQTLNHTHHVPLDADSARTLE
jgi:hypothetical protein